MKTIKLKLKNSRLFHLAKKTHTILSTDLKTKVKNKPKCERKTIKNAIPKIISNSIVTTCTLPDFGRWIYFGPKTLWISQLRSLKDISQRSHSKSTILFEPILNNIESTFFISFVSDSLKTIMRRDNGFWQCFKRFCVFENNVPLWV